MIVAWLDERLPESEHYFVNFKGEICDETYSAGLKCYINITHPEYILFGEKIGIDISQEDDGHVVGQTCLSFRNSRVNITSRKSSHRFAVIGLTTGTGEPLFIVVIFSAFKPDMIGQLGSYR